MSTQKFGFYQKEQKLLWGRSRVWFILSVMAFVVSWLFLHMLDRYMLLQPELLKLSVPPNLTEALLVPLSQNLIKVMLLLVAVTAGSAIAQERQENTLVYLWRGQSGPWLKRPVVEKFKSHLWLMSFPLLTLGLTAILLAFGGDINWWHMVAMMLALVLCGMWLIALALFLSSLTNQTGFAVLLSVVVFILLWVIGGQTALDEYGVNWLNLILPEQHFNWLNNGQLNVSSVLYFLGGSVLLLWMANQQINRFRTVQ